MFNLYLRMIIKSFMYSLPINYRVWRFLGIFRHGRADSSEYSYEICEEYYDFYLSYSDISERIDFDVLEFGSGDAVSAGIYFSTKGARSTHLIDTRSFATRNMKVYYQFCNLLGINPNFRNFEELLDKFSIYYLTDGVTSLENIQKASISFAYSHSVLQHLTDHELDEFIKQLYIKLGCNGLSRHRIDLRNMYDQSNRHYQVPNFVWNLSWLTKLPFYTNRLSIEDYIVKFKSAGFQILNVNKIEDVITSTVDARITNCEIIAFDIELRKN